MLILTRRRRETLMIGTEITVPVLEVKGNQVRIGVSAPRNVGVHREEIFEKIRAQRVDETRSNDERGTVRRVIRHSPHYPAPSLMGDLAMGSLRLVWRLTLLPTLTFLVILQPVVGLVFGGLALLGVLMSFFLKLSGAAPHFPFLTLLAISAGFGLVLIGYEALVRCFSR